VIISELPKFRPSTMKLRVRVSWLSGIKHLEFHTRHETSRWDAMLPSVPPHPTPLQALFVVEERAAARSSLYLPLSLLALCCRLQNLMYHAFNIYSLIVYIIISNWCQKSKHRVLRRPSQVASIQSILHLITQIHFNFIPVRILSKI
jgi:hypothetical protein